MTSRLALLVICIFGAAIRLYYLNAPIGEDEAMTYGVYASQPLSQALADYSAPNNHLFHTLLVHLVSRVGSAEWILRLPALLAGTLLIPATYMLGQTLYGSRAALFGAAWVAASSPLIEYSTNARGYTLVALFATLGFWMAAKWLSAPRLGTALRLVVCIALGFYTIPIMLYPFSGIILWWLWSSLRTDDTTARRQRVLSIAAIIVGVLFVTALLYSPVLLNGGAAPLVANRFVAPLRLEQWAAQYIPQWLKIAQFWTRDIPLLLVLLVLAGTVITLRFHRHISPYPVALLLAVIIASVVLTLIQRVAPWERVWLPLLPLVAVSAVGCVELIAPRLSRLALLLSPTAVGVCLMLCALIMARHPVAPFGDLAVERDAANVARAFARVVQGDPAVSVQIVPSSASLIYYFEREAIPPYYLVDIDAIDAQTVFVVVLKPDYTIERMIALLRQFGFEDRGYDTPLMVQEFDYATLYRLARIDSR